MAQRRLANQAYEAARERAIAAKRRLREEEQNRRLIAAVEGRYARALNRTSNIRENIQSRANDAATQVASASAGIGNASRGNYLTNLYQGRQREFARGGAGMGLSPELQQQARNIRGAWDLATAGGRENLQLMQRIATEMAGLLRQQNELNRGRTGRSTGFETGRRGQERITALSAMPGADPARIRRLRSQATDVISASNTGDIAGSREATRRMNASIGRYTRELNTAATELRQRQRGGARNVNVNSSWQVALSDMQDIAATASRASGKRFNDKLKKEEARQASLGIGASAPQRIGGPTRRVSAIPMGGGIDSGIMPRALPSKEMLRDRVAGSQQRQPSRLDELQAAQQKQLAEEAKRAAGSLGRFGAAVEREEKRQRSLGIGAPSRASGSTQRGGAIPMGGQGGRPGMFNQYASPAGPGNPVGIGQFRAEQKRQQGQKGFFQGDARSAIGDALIGGAFPALFGQGLGASTGGAAGGLVGGLVGGNFGFGLSLIGTAVGQAVDTTVNNLTELADAIRSPSKALDALEKSGLASSRGLEQTKLYVDQLTAVGRSYDAQTLVLQEVQKRLGPGSLTELGKLDTAQQKVQEQFGLIASEIQVRLLPVLQGFVEFLGNAAGDISGFSSQSRLERTDSKRFEQLRSQATRESSRFAVNVAGVQLGFGGDKKKYEARLSELSKQELAKRFANERAQVPQTPQEKLAGEMAQIQESRKIADQIQSAYREAFGLQRQAYDLQRDGAKLNKDIADYSYKKEREIFDLRQQAAEKQIENNRARAQNRIESSDLNARQTFAAAVGFEQQLLTNVREVVRSRKEGEADIEQSRNRLELAMAKLNRDVEDYKRTNAREIEDIEQRKLSYVRSVEDYKMKVADHVLQRAREAADLMRQAMTLPDMGAATAAPGGSARTGVVGGVGNMLPGTKGGPNINEGVGYGRGRLHAGRDLGLDVGDPIHARRAGTVTQSYSSGFGKVGGAVVIRYDDGTQGTYGHTTPGVRQGQKVEAGQRIATVTTDPNPRNTHLHYELRDQLGKLLEPLAYVLASIRAPAGAASNIQGQTATQISNIPGPKFSPVPIGTTPSVAPINAANMAARLQLAGGEKEALKILEEQNKLKQKGIELGQIEQILQANQLPQLKQQEDTLKQQIEARQRILDLSDNAASVADIEAESKSRLKQIELDRVSALASAKKKYGDDPAIAKQINFQAGKATEIAKNEEKQRRINLDLNNKLQNQERARSAILQLQETLATGKAEAAALERGKLQASNVELLKASELYQLASEAEKTKLALLTAQTEELSKQNEFRKRINEIRNEARFTGAGLRAGMIGAPARAFEEEMKRSGNIDRATGLANETKLLENQQLVWGNLEKNIVATSDAISGALTNGLVSIADGSRKIEDVGRDMLRAISSSFADSAQQQLTTLLQRQMGGLFQAIASQGLLSGLGGAGAGGLGGGLGAALSGSLGNIGSAFSVPTFGGFMAKGGITKPGEVYVTGEKEPEFFFPGVTGRVVPRSDMQKAEALRNSGNESDSLDISYTVREERGERYVTEDQLRKSNAMVERRAFAKTINGMKNNGALRDSINI
jgi:murein DD-endopeptidase MepM/ murein hydrolase activator NlpD